MNLVTRNKFIEHVNHDVKLVYYGSDPRTGNVSLECVHCNEVIYDFDTEAMLNSAYPIIEAVIGKQMLEGVFNLINTDHINETIIRMIESEVESRLYDLTWEVVRNIGYGNLSNLILKPCEVCGNSTKSNRNSCTCDEQDKE